MLLFSAVISVCFVLICYVFMSLLRKVVFCVVVSAFLYGSRYARAVFSTVLSPLLTHYGNKLPPFVRRYESTVCGALPRNPGVPSGLVFLVLLVCGRFSPGTLVEDREVEQAPLILSCPRKLGKDVVPLSVVLAPLGVMFAPSSSFLGSCRSLGCGGFHPLHPWPFSVLSLVTYVHS